MEQMLADEEERQLQETLAASQKEAEEVAASASRMPANLAGELLRITLACSLLAGGKRKRKYMT